MVLDCTNSLHFYSTMVLDCTKRWYSIVLTLYTSTLRWYSIVLNDDTKRLYLILTLLLYDGTRLYHPPHGNTLPSPLSLPNDTTQLYLFFTLLPNDGTRRPPPHAVADPSMSSHYRIRQFRIRKNNADISPSSLEKQSTWRSSAEASHRATIRS